MTDPALVSDATPYRLLSLDGGGAKGFYTLGVLKEVEAMLARPLCEHFGLIYGTSTGAIIAALLALGKPVDEIHATYKEHVPTVMKATTAAGRSKALTDLATKVFGDVRFEDAKTGLGIVTTQWDLEKPKIFKTHKELAHGRLGTFVPGFGCSVSEAVQASCSAYPFFDRVFVTLKDGKRVELGDGGYCANNPTLYAIADALGPLRKSRDSLRVLSVGVGTYPPKPEAQLDLKTRTYLWMCNRLCSKFNPQVLLQKTLDINTESMAQLREILFKDVQTVRINETFQKPEMATDLLEHDLTKLDLLYQRGAESFAREEEKLKTLLA